jgi:hypothetical protein
MPRRDIIQQMLPLSPHYSILFLLLLSLVLPERNLFTQIKAAKSMFIFKAFFPLASTPEQHIHHFLLNPFPSPVWSGSIFKCCRVAASCRPQKSEEEGGKVA